MSTENLDMAVIDKHLQEYTKQKQRGWFRRNWLWFVPLDLLVVAIIVAVVLYWAFYTRVYSLPLCQSAMLVIAADGDVQKAIGEPIETAASPSRDTVPSARVEENEVDVIWTIRGPKGHAKAHATARKRQGNWDTVVLEVTFSDGKRKSLNAEGGNEAVPWTPPTNAGGSDSGTKKPETKGSDLNIDFAIPSADAAPEPPKK